MTDIFSDLKYDKEKTLLSPIHKNTFLIDYNSLVKREGGKTVLQDISVIDMDSLKNSLGIIPAPKSMDLTLVASKINKNSQKKICKYILADFKFNVTSLDKVDKNISKEDIKGKFQFSDQYIRSVDFNISCFDIAFFIFTEQNFEQIKNRWLRRNLNSPKNMPIRLSDFEILFNV